MDDRMGGNMDELLEKLRRINHMLQKEGGFVTNSGEATALPFTEMASVLGDILRANTYLIDLSGNLLGYSEATDINNTRIKQMLEDKKFPEQYAQNLSALFQTTANIGIESDFTAFPISKVSASQNIDPVHDIKVEKQRYPKLSLNAEVSYIRVHNIQTIHCSQLAIGVLSSLSETYPDLYAEVKAAYRDFSGGLF